MHSNTCTGQESMLTSRTTQRDARNASSGLSQPACSKDRVSLCCVSELLNSWLCRGNVDDLISGEALSGQ